jgi:menaquinone-dependent protoporphyrinogen oxidase
MSPRVLVAYASEAGSTAEIAQAIGDVLRASGPFLVDVVPAATASGLAGYDAVVLGSAIHNGKVLPEAMAFVTRERSGLAAIPVAYFLVCAPFDWSLFPGIRKAMDKWLDPLRAIKAPVQVGLFAGRFGPEAVAAINPLWRFALAAVWALGRHPGQTTGGDWRDWAQIRAWAAGLARLLATRPAEAREAVGATLAARPSG